MLLLHLGLLAFGHIALAQNYHLDESHGWCYCYRDGVVGVTGDLDEGLTSATCNKFPIKVTFDELDHKCYASSGHSDIDGDTWHKHCKLTGAAGYDYNGVHYKWSESEIGGACS
ncbi:hypothetical protein C8034_v010401 [Colletotrichum sidae]|uniref:Uncharacterized protein n=3 Tax=Colletotrichum orbiculare species complex TaxID=2707354 RepID=N4VHN3_COLOR|nr:hypothetical protein Cob_v002163 [Colletotrichum orbiculare MAFF 240422]TDZ31733.1 hypothetical protein C8035_v001274 [Colletotrichum spinosum]TEA18645.1 hypothetical protein C8034_v010401 [Colletotrichum sidae]